MSGFELQQELAIKDIQIPTIFLTGHGDIPTSVRAIKAGALEFLTKPFEDAYLLKAIREAIVQDDKHWRASGRIANASCEDDIGTDAGSRSGPNQLEIVTSSRLNGKGKPLGEVGQMIGRSRAWQKIIEEIEMVAPTDVTVLVLGETRHGPLTHL